MSLVLNVRDKIFRSGHKLSLVVSTDFMLGGDAVLSYVHKCSIYGRVLVFKD